MEVGDVHSLCSWEGKNSQFNDFLSHVTILMYGRVYFCWLNNVKAPVTVGIDKWWGILWGNVKNALARRIGPVTGNRSYRLLDFEEKYPLFSIPEDVTVKLLWYLRVRAVVKQVADLTYPHLPLPGIRTHLSANILFQSVRSM